jgi:hypothetical protein
MKVKMVKIESSQIEAVGYDEKTEILRVEFKSHNPNKPPSVYEYKGINAVRYANFMNSESKGKFFGEFIKPCYPYRQINSTAEGEKAGEWTCLKAVKYKGGCAACQIVKCLDYSERMRQMCGGAQK